MLAVCGGLGGAPVRVAIAALGAGVVGVLIVAVAVGGTFVDPTVARIERTRGTVSALGRG